MTKIAARMPRVSMKSLWLIVAVLVFSACSPTRSNSPAVVSNPIPVLAYYYIWFDTQSWERAKTDYPILGRYSSSNVDVMRQHVKWAKEAGITGFIVSWKSTDRLNERLEKLIQVAIEENFKLAIIYQGLDFQRDPLPVEQVDADLSYFIEHYSEEQAFYLYDKPLVVWSGTWEFSRDEVESVVVGKREHILILASERNVDGYMRLADLVDGDAYYWSSVNPDTFPGYPEKLTAMSEAIHANSGLWIAPAAPGFDARLIGGTTIVDRKNGETLQIQFNTAMQSSPDAIGLISWNEFSENSHIEPSENYGDRYLKMLSRIQNVPAPVVRNFDSSEPGNTTRPNTTSDTFGGDRLLALGVVGLLVVISLFVILRRMIHP
ncbi:MAG TPA: endo-1,3-alpha-glucanase family glycosylhydrolase [Anaerolineales bacterium]|nr:endo-1,3-alpha-glucanase family glycosylhydrolase [Anaerolineales bacterium]